MVNNILIVSRSCISSGIRALEERLNRALLLEGLNTRMIKASCFYFKGLIDEFFRNYPSMLESRRIIVMGSIPPFSLLFLREGIKVGLFVHGLILDEHKPLLLKALGSLNIGSLREICMNIVKWSFLARHTANYYICHSLTTCERNNLTGKKYVLLPQFITNNDLLMLRKERFIHSKDIYQSNGKIIIVTYMSSVPSPRLLDNATIIHIIRQVAKKTKRDIGLVIIDPTYKDSIMIEKGNLSLRIINKTLPKEIFLRMLASAHIYIERNTDEELRFTTLEAGLLNTAIAKITLPPYIYRQDYSADEFILAHSTRDLVDKLSEAISSRDLLEEYRTRIRGYIKNYRHWNKVKRQFIETLY